MDLELALAMAFATAMLAYALWDVISPRDDDE